MQAYKIQVLKALVIIEKTYEMQIVLGSNYDDFGNGIKAYETGRISIMCRVCHYGKRRR